MQRTAAVTFILFSFLGRLGADEMRIMSPDSGQTFSFSSVNWKQLRWAAGSQSLIASITFSNYEYVSRVEPREDDRFDFPLPGVTFDRATGVFSAHDHSRSIPVAILRREWFFSTIVLLPGAQIVIHKQSGKVRVELVASTEPIRGERWVERDEQQIVPGF